MSAEPPVINAGGFVTSLWDLPHTARYLRSIGAVSRSMLKAAVVEQVGKYFKTIATIRFKQDGQGAWVLDAPSAFMPASDQLPLILNEVAQAKWPKSIPYRGPMWKECLPDPFRTMSLDNFFQMRSAAPAEGVGDVANLHPDFQHELLMLLVRIDHDGRLKDYKPLTYFEDGKFREKEPDGPLPIFGAEQIRELHGKKVAFLHEGPKAARAARRIADAYDTWALKNLDRPISAEGDAAHPWAFELAEGIHLGWLGGAYRTGDTDWSELRRELKQAGIERVIIVGDNDREGKAALPIISELLDMAADHVIFPEKAFKDHFDLADEFPGGGPSFGECLQPGTFMTKTISVPNPSGKGAREIAVLTKAGAKEWIYVPLTKNFIHTRHTALMLDQDQLNAYLRPLSHSSNTAKLIEGAAYETGRAVGIAYDPSQMPGIIADGENAAVNRHRPSGMNPKVGDVKPFLDFLAYLIPDEADRKELERWCATLIARPDIHMLYAVLLVSEQQGIGKTVLSNILGTLVGIHNTSFPSEEDVASPYNEWIAEKRLAVIAEIYAGQSWKMYNSLKSAITDPHITVNRKHQRQYRVRNWIHIIAGSNSSRALKMADDDRRWFVPEVNEERKPRQYFVEFHAWLKAEGYRIIIKWAKDFEKTGSNRYVGTGDHAPQSSTKLKMISENRSDVGRQIEELGQRMAQSKKPLVITVRELQLYAKSCASGWHERVMESGPELTRIVCQPGNFKLQKRVKVWGLLDTLVLNPAAKKLFDDRGERPMATVLEPLMKKPVDIMAIEM